MVGSDYRKCCVTWCGSVTLQTAWTHRELSETLLSDWGGCVSQTMKNRSTASATQGRKTEQKEDEVNERKKEKKKKREEKERKTRKKDRRRRRRRRKKNKLWCGINKQEQQTKTPPNLRNERGKKKKKNPNSTRCSQAVTHPSTNRARRYLTSVIGREPVLSTWYGRWRQTAKNIRL